MPALFPPASPPCHPRGPRLAVLVALALPLLAACGGDEGDWPQLLPSEALLAEPPALAARPEAQAQVAATDPLVARANALRDRAERLRKRPVIDPALLARMQGAGA